MKIAPVGFCVIAALAQLAFGAGEPASLRQRAIEHCPQIVFAVRSMGGDGHWYANFGHHVSSPDGMQYGPGGGQLCRLDLRTDKVEVLLDDPKGGVRDPVVSYDARKVLFSYRKGGTRYYHLYEMNTGPSGALGAGGSGIRQITDGPFDEIEPIYLPDGDLLFCSSRCNRFVQCWFTQVAVMYRSGPNGENIRLVSANVEQDNTPWMMPDGRVLYMRWEYVDRSRVQYHHLWTINPDGTGVMTYFGNMHAGTVLLDAKPIAGTNKVVSVFSPGHGSREHAGQIGIINPDAGPDERKWVTYVGKGGNYRDPYPLAEDLFLAAEESRIVLLDAAGRSETIFTVAGANMKAHEPRPLTSRPREHLIPPRTHPDEASGRLILADVTHGRNMGGVKAGEIKKLLVMESLPKPVNFSGSMEPLTLNGSFTLPRILGTVPVEADGSAYMELPALRPLFFVALDERGMSVKRMQSFVSVMPGETTSCSGCHEDRTDAVRQGGIASAGLLATRRAPSPVEPIADVPDVMDFPRDIQPILDRHCIKCHNYDQPPPKGVPLVGARGPVYSHSYFALMDKNYVSHGRDAGGNTPPRRIGSSASRLMKQIDGTHNSVVLTELEQRKIRLWIESGAPYPGTYAALGTGMVPAPADADVIGRRCGACHHPKDIKKPLTAFKTSEDLVVNLTDPARSPILLAPLAKDAGGWGLCKGELRSSRRGWPRDPDAMAEPAATSNVSAIFDSADDGDYRKLLAGIEKSKKQLDQATRFDKPDFHPNRHYVREMKRYGILPADADPDGRQIDVYATDHAYWRSFWYQPVGN
jgi:hypothetical protein